MAVCEILRMTGRVRDMIVDPTQTGKLVEVIASGGYYGMQTFDQALFGHVKAGRVTFEDAMSVASSPHDFKLLMQADGRKGHHDGRRRFRRGSSRGRAGRTIARRARRRPARRGSAGRPLVVALSALAHRAVIACSGAANEHRDEHQRDHDHRYLDDRTGGRKDGHRSDDTPAAAPPRPFGASLHLVK